MKLSCDTLINMIMYHSISNLVFCPVNGRVSDSTVGTENSPLWISCWLMTFVRPILHIHIYTYIVLMFVFSKQKTPSINNIHRQKGQAITARGIIVSSCWRKPLASLRQFLHAKLSMFCFDVALYVTEFFQIYLLYLFCSNRRMRCNCVWIIFYNIIFSCLLTFRT